MRARKTGMERSHYRAVRGKEEVKMNDIGNSNVYVERVSAKMQIEPRRSIGAMGNGMVPVEFFVDLPNIEKSLKRLGCFKTDYGELIDAVLRRFAQRLGIKTACRPMGVRDLDYEAVSAGPAAFRHAVWCVTSTPVNFHPADADWIKNRCRFITALRRRHHFHVEEVPLDFRGNHICHEYGRASDGPKEPAWHPKETAVDVLLAVRMVKRCLSPDRPAGVILMSGDADYAPALYEVSRRDPPIIVMVAAFSDAISEVYFSGDPAGYIWQSTPILLDNCLRNMHSKREDHPVEPSYSTIAVAV